MEINTTYNADWLQWIAPERFNDSDLFKIVVFFVFHSPCSELSVMGRTLLEYGWKMPWRKPYKLNLQLKEASSNHNLIFSAKSYGDMDKALEKANLKDEFPLNLETERVCVYDNLNNQFMSTFYHIRNAFAHGRLNMMDVNGECVFVLEDIVKNRKKGICKVSARMILRKNTLLKWIEIIENGECEYIAKERA